MKKSIIIVLGALFLLPSFAEAITRRADKECLLCHVLWFDAFKTDQKTLIEHSDSSIVIAGSRGLASSEAMCVTCHDGYVVDSRVRVTEGNPHHALKIVPESLKLPELFRLNRNNEIYCGTCHTLHDFTESAAVGSTPFIRFENERSQMCIACHGGKTEQLGVANHPVLNEAKDIPLLEAAKKGARFGPSREIICQSCHHAHGKQALVSPVNNSSLCTICHPNKKSLINGKHDLRSTLPDIKNIKQQRPSESGPCGVCHIPHKAAGRKIWAKRLAPENQASQMCLTCHAEQTGVKTKRVGQYSHPTSVMLPSTESLPSELPLYLADATRDPGGRVQCFTCHNAHQWDPTSPDKIGGKNIEGDASNSFLRILNNSGSALCLKCHSDKTPVITSDHNLEITAPQEKNIQGFNASQSGPCGACHIPHNAAGKKLWARRISPGSQAPQMCLTCHSQETGFKTKLIGKHSHPVDIQPASKGTLPKTLPLFLADTTKDPAGRVQCFTCHNVHRWDPNSPTKNSGKNLEGDTSTSFLRISNSLSSVLCVECHADKKQVISSDHNLKLTAPEEKNIQGFTAGIAGPCGACHVPHNASGIKLWAKPLSTDTSLATQLCTGCHQKAGAAKTKLIGDNSHPVEITLKELNIQRSSDRKMIKLPLYGDDGIKIPAGKLACLTCHEPHTWDAKQSRADLNDTLKNKEGDATSSFLRQANYPSSDLCKNCHPAKANVDGTDHDLKITAPLATNVLGQTVKVSGACGACHLVHNSPNKLKLWARSYGPISENEGIMNALCTSCHSKGNMAEKKVPLITTHPAGKLINNIIRFNKNKTGYTPIFDQNGRETNVGEISCPSCHNAHQWSPFPHNRTDPQIPKDNEMDKFRFLRNMSYNTVCINCHGPQALYRYLYFHSQDKRKKMQFIPAHQALPRRSIF
jgi:predicted CXXCH cytochrome family protein